MTGASASEPVFHHMRKTFSKAFVCVLALVAGQFLFGQNTGSISGTVLDAQLDERCPARR